MKKSIYLFLCCLIISVQVQAQVGINSSGANPDQSAMLDIESSSKGVLIPRMNSSQRGGISNAATGLLVFDTQEGSFFYYNGMTWDNLSKPSTLSDKDKDTKIQVEESADEDIIRFDIQGAERLRLRPNQHGVLMVEPRISNNTFYGLNAGLNTEPLQNGDGLHNTFVGYEAGQDNTEGSKNTLLGSYAGFELDAGHRNVYLGFETGKFNVNGNGNVWIGSEVGNASSGSNQLKIDNQNSATPLVYGEFNNDMLRINGEFQVTSDATISNDLTVTNNATISNDLSVTNDATISNDLTVSEDLEVGNRFRFNTTGNTPPFHVNLTDTVIVGARFQINGSTKMSIHNNGGVSIGEYLTVNTKVPDNGLYIKGNVNLGTSTLYPDYRLQIDGKVACEEVNVELSQNWPDYVFQENYELASLNSVESFIKDNGHLPGVPSAAEVKANGVFLGKMQTIMMEKIEELTLHIIRLEKENKEIKSLLQLK